MSRRELRTRSSVWVQPVSYLVYYWGTSHSAVASTTNRGQLLHKPPSPFSF